jgi:hypothetical protein
LLADQTVMWQVPFTSPKRTIYNNQVTLPRKKKGYLERVKSLFGFVLKVVVIVLFVIYYNNIMPHLLGAYHVPNMELILRI